MKLVIYYFLILSIFVFSNCKHKHKAKVETIQLDTNNNVIILTFGGPSDIKYINAQNVIANKWGIRYHSVGNCTISRELSDSVDSYNKLTKVFLNKKFGRNWKSKFYKEIEIELLKQKLIYQILDNEEKIISKDNELSKQGNGLHYRVKYKDINQYVVNVTGWGQLNGNDEYVSYFRYLVDVKNHKLILLSDSLIKY